MSEEPWTGVFEAHRYARDRFFFYEMPDLHDLAFYDSWGIDPRVLIGQNQLGDFRIFLDDRDPSTEQDRNYTGYAVANLAPGLDEAVMDHAFRSAPATARWPADSNADPAGVSAKWRELDASEVEWVFYLQADGSRRVMGFYLRRLAVRDDEVLAVSFDNAAGSSVGSVDGAAAEVKLRLIRHAQQNAVVDEESFDLYPTNLLMMRHVYVLGTPNIQGIDVRIEDHKSSDEKFDVPDNVPHTTYLHMFGLDDFDQFNAPNPDGEFDQFRANVIDRENGFLFMPGLRPFSPPDQVVSERLVSAGINSALAFNPVSRDSLFGPSEIIDHTMYILPAHDPRLPGFDRTIAFRTYMPSGIR